MKRTKKEKNLLLIIDGNNTAYRSAAVMKLESSIGSGTSAVYGTLQSLRMLIVRYKPDDVIVCWDGGHSKFRKKLYPEYKVHTRSKTSTVDREDFLHQIKKLKKLIRLLGIKQYFKKGVEADDLICKLSMLHKGKVLIASTDNDFLQLVSKKVSVLNPVSNIVWTTKNFHQFKDYGFKIVKEEKLSRYLQMKAIMGDPSDNIKGVEGVGEATSLKIMIEFSYYLHAISNYKIVCNSKKKKVDWRLRRFSESVKIIKRNMKLMDLKYFCKEHLKDEDVKLFKPRFKMKTFLSTISKSEFSFLSIVDEIKYWSIPFKKLYIRNKKGGN